MSLNEHKKEMKMIHKVNDKFAIIIEKTTYRKNEGTVVVCVSHAESSKVKSTSIAYLKALKVLTSENLVSNIKVEQNSPCCTEITYDVSNVLKVSLSDAKDELRNLISI